MAAALPSSNSRSFFFFIFFLFIIILHTIRQGYTNSRMLTRVWTLSFWQQVHRVNKFKKPIPVSSVDGVSGSNQVSQLFFSKLQSLSNSQHTSGCAPHCSSSLTSLSADDLKASAISVECVVEAFSHLKCGKSDSGSLSSDHLIYALPAISSSLASPFTAILRHGFMPELLRDCMLVPIPKGNKDPTISDNYRPIALVSTLSKALEWCILLSYPDHFCTSSLQFGFKKKMSTSLCSGTVKNVISRYVHEGSAVYACFLDVSKAFYLVSHEILLAGCWTEIFLFSSSPSLCHGTKISAFASGGMALSLTVSMSPMVSRKEVFSPQFCLLFMLMTS